MAIGNMESDNATLNFVNNKLFWLRISYCLSIDYQLEWKNINPRIQSNLPLLFNLKALLLAIISLLLPAVPFFNFGA